MTTKSDLPSLLAESAVRRVLATYAHAADDGRLDDLAALFGSSGVFCAAEEVHQGSSNIAAFLRGRFRPDRRSRHVIFNTVVDADDAGATALSDFVVMSHTGGAWINEVVGRYSDSFVEVEGDWFFRRHEIEFC
jgi:hypothetical protein